MLNFPDGYDEKNQDQDFTMKFIGTSYSLYTKLSTKFGVALQSFCENQNSVQDQDLDQDHDFTLNFNTRPTFHT